MAGDNGSRVGPNFDLPDEILSVIPTDPYDQLDLARKITSMAIASRVTNLETEANSLRQVLQEKDQIIRDLEDALRIAQEDNVKIMKERDSLAVTSKKLGRDLARMESFKKQLMLSLNDDNSPHAETVDIGTYEQSSPRAYSSKDDESSNGYKRNLSSDSLNGYASNGQEFSMTTYHTNRLITPGIGNRSSGLSSRGYSASGSPLMTPGTASPTTLYDGRGSLSAWFPSSQHSSTTNSPPYGNSARTSRVDGKEFFRQARSRLSLEQFTAFLANIKELNAQKQSREETLTKAEEIFGSDNKDLYISFQGLLNRRLH